LSPPRKPSHSYSKQPNKDHGRKQALPPQYSNTNRLLLMDATKEKYEKELKEFGTEKNKLKGQIRALQEQYDQLKRDTQSATQKKDRAEKESRAALAKKKEYEKEAKTVKKALESYRVELASLAKTKQEAATKATPGQSERPTKKQKTGKQVKGGTIVKSMKVAELKEEAVARGIDVKELTRINKDSLLNILVVGSRRILMTDAWDEVVSLRKTFAEERQKAAQLERQRQWREQEKKRQEEEQRWREQEKKRQEEEQRWREQEKNRQKQIEKDRAEEISKQREFHSLSVSKKVHGCKLAFTKDLLVLGTPRIYYARCDECGGNVEYTCEGCDYDICKECFKEKNMTASEKKAVAKRKAAEEKEQQRVEAEKQRVEAEKQRVEAEKWDPNIQFVDKIINPSDKNKDPDGNKSKGFTVWCSDGYGNDGWHSYEGSPAKEFDTTYVTKKEANERARYLFQWKNPWGLEADEFEEGAHEIDESTNEGMISYVVTPDDSTTWSVGVVPDAAFPYLDNATRTRHHYDRDYF
jgi:hypothetical protein